MITAKNISVSVSNSTQKKQTSIIEFINNKIEQEQQNSFGIIVLFMMISTMISSISIGLALHNGFSYPIVAISSATAMGTNAAAFSQRSFKTVVWFGIVSIFINTLLVIIQFPKLF